MTIIEECSLLRQTGRGLNKPAMHPIPAVSLIKDPLTENSPQQCFRDLDNSEASMTDRQTPILLLPQQIFR